MEIVPYTQKMKIRGRLKISWSNYLVLPKYKLVFEISRYLEDIELGEDIVAILDDSMVASKIIDLDIPYCNLTIKLVADLEGTR